MGGKEIIAIEVAAEGRDKGYTLQGVMKRVGSSERFVELIAPAILLQRFPLSNKTTSPEQPSSSSAFAESFSLESNLSQLTVSDRPSFQDLLLTDYTAYLNSIARGWRFVPVGERPAIARRALYHFPPEMGDGPFSLVIKAPHYPSMEAELIKAFLEFQGEGASAVCGMLSSQQQGREGSTQIVLWVKLKKFALIAEMLGIGSGLVE